ncbi:MAG: FTR1 family protein [Pseudohongiellaceae bacterium]
MTSAVIIFLREILEAMMIVSVLLASSSVLRIPRKWVGLALLIGLAGAGLYALMFSRISDAFEGVGQEVINAILLFAICVSLAVYANFIVSRIRSPVSRFPQWPGVVAIIFAVGCAITREGVELYIYLSGYAQGPEALLPIILGGTLGSGIGLSLGALIYIAVVSLSRFRSLLISCMLMIPVAAGMASQASNYLMQADLLTAQMPLWDSSNLISETSIPGELLYAIFSYEATPTPFQVMIYLGVAAIIIASFFAMQLLANQQKRISTLRV